GTLQAVGTGDDPIVFASTSGETQTEGSWNGIDIRDTTTELDSDGNWIQGSRIEHVVVSGATNGILTTDSHLTVDHSRFENNTRGVRSSGPIGNRLLYVRNSEFSANAAGVVVNQPTEVLDSVFLGNDNGIVVSTNSVTARGNLFTGNTRGVWFTEGDGGTRLIEENRLDGNTYGIQIETGNNSATIIRRNIITRSEQFWLRVPRPVFQNHDLRVEDNIAADNGLGLISEAGVGGSQRGLLSGNALIRNGSGVLFDNRGSGKTYTWTATGNLFSDTGG
ncbi:unnamed protein product, partial [Discosporangium mesarthrocarpum]